MSKCQHGQKITHFCLTETCQYKQGAGCQLCFKKYHNHISQAIFSSDDQIQNLIKKFSLQNSVKPRCRILQQSIYSYFSQVKLQISGSLDAVCKNIINQIGYPYLFSNNNLTMYKRLKNKEYRKIPQKQLRLFYQFVNKLQQRQLIREQNKIYNMQIKNINQFIIQLQQIIQNYQSIVKTYHNTFQHQNFNQQRVIEIIKSIIIQSPSKITKTTTESSDSKNKTKQNLKTTHGNYNVKNYQIQPIQIKQKAQKIQAEMDYLLPGKNEKGRDISLDKKLVKQHKFNDIQKQQSNNRTGNTNLEHVKIQLNNKQIGMNQKKKLLIDIMKPSEKITVLKNQLTDFPSIKSKFQDNAPKQRVTTETKSYNQSKSSVSSEDLAGIEEFKSKQTKNYAFTKLPIQDIPKKVQKQAVNKKLFIVPAQINTKGSNSNKIHELDSPLYKKRKIQDNNDFVKPKQQEEKTDLINKKIEQEKSKYKQILEIKQYQQKSLALLLKSLTLTADDAIIYLESALKYAQNNLSAAQYLSYLYLQTNRPKDCLKICCKYLQRLENSHQPQQLTINLHNNKAAALNILGRYSEAILQIQQCLRYKEKDTFYKIIGDSYFSIGIYEKAMYNYQKSIKINPKNDQSHYNLAVCLYIQQNYAHAKISIKKALQLHPKHQIYTQLESQIDLKTKIC